MRLPAQSGRPVQPHSQRAIIDLAHQQTALRLQDGLYGWQLGPTGTLPMISCQEEKLDSRHLIFDKVVHLHHIHVLA